MEVKAARSGGAACQRSYDQPQNLNIQSTQHRTQSDGLVYIEIPRSPSACKASSYRKEEFLGNEGRATAMLAFDH